MPPRVCCLFKLLQNLPYSLPPHLAWSGLPYSVPLRTHQCLDLPPQLWLGFERFHALCCPATAQMFSAASALPKFCMMRKHRISKKNMKKHVGHENGGTCVNLNSIRLSCFFIRKCTILSFSLPRTRADTTKNTLARFGTNQPPNLPKTGHRTGHSTHLNTLNMIQDD